MPDDIPPSHIRDPLAPGDCPPRPIASVLERFAAQENCDGDPQRGMVAAAARLRYLEGRVDVLSRRSQRVQDDLEDIRDEVLNGNLSEGDIRDELYDVIEHLASGA